MKKEGNERTVKRFALFPVRMTDHRWIWFKWFMKQQECIWFHYIEEVDVGPSILGLCTHEHRRKLTWKTVSKREIL